MAKRGKEEGLQFNYLDDIGMPELVPTDAHARVEVDSSDVPADPPSERNISVLIDFLRPYGIVPNIHGARATFSIGKNLADDVEDRIGKLGFHKVRQTNHLGGNVEFVVTL